ncbi:tellurium resistance protein TerC, partial [Klebsiella aerogenes]|nr:tellurium resistance protein TerC [Klebsiella aerogenes]
SLVNLEKAVHVLLFLFVFQLGLHATDHLRHHGYSISATASLYVVLVVLILGIVASFVFQEKNEEQPGGS